jgi:hypothetical protein
MRMLFIPALGLALLTAACGETSTERTGTGAVGGATAGAIVGGPIGAVVGAGVGAVGGAERNQIDRGTHKVAGAAQRGVDSVVGGNPDSSAAAPNAEARQTMKQAQQELKTLRLYNGPIDGIYGPRTKAAIAAFQARHSLAQTGQLDAETRQQLDALASARGGAPGSGNSSQQSAR